MSTKRLATLAGLLLAVASASILSAEPVVFSGLTMGTAYHVKVVGVEPADAAVLQRDIQAVLADVEQRLSTYRRNSEVSRFNRAPPGQWFAVSPATAQVVAAALHLCRQSDGALDITVAPFVQLWHFGPSSLSRANASAEFVPPDEPIVRAVLQRVGYEKLDVRLDPPALRKGVDGLEIDLSSIGEGHAIDRIAALFAERGVDHYLIELGGEVRAAGNRASGRPWRVAVRRPSPESNQFQTALPLENASLATSGDYQRFFEHAGRRYSHVIDPATGRPVSHALASATVAADACQFADGWATALLVLGPERGYDVAVKHKIAALLISPRR